MYAYMYTLTYGDLLERVLILNICLNIHACYICRKYDMYVCMYVYMYVCMKTRLMTGPQNLKRWEMFVEKIHTCDMCSAFMNIRMCVCMCAYVCMRMYGLIRAITGRGNSKKSEILSTTQF